MLPEVDPEPLKGAEPQVDNLKSEEHTQYSSSIIINHKEAS